ncbi:MULTISPECIES: hypothetical protein [Aeribacillus]|uniref:Uncharacterized protein n=1 Tax=Aeribacillus composti TaxID=1868734 RepID=A0ABY9WCB7_9BACI|nr:MULTISPECIES: hypothetical protein [Aeribacillus]MED0701091.1 hypothetical protein [Aeribacillus composti]WNF33789.1 hypothetical protein RI196_03640 [Aeribacillus composti]
MKEPFKRAGSIIDLFKDNMDDREENDLYSINLTKNCEDIVGA